MKLLHILLVEDNDADVFLVRQALSKHHVEHKLHVAKDGYEALQFVSTIGTPDSVACLDLLLLDLNLPKVDGTDVLREFSEAPALYTHAGCGYQLIRWRKRTRPT